MKPIAIRMLKRYACENGDGAVETESQACAGPPEKVWPSSVPGPPD